MGIGKLNALENIYIYIYSMLFIEIKLESPNE